MSGTLATSQARMDAVIRVLGLVCVIVGAVFAYFISQTTLIPQLVPIFYFMAATLIFAGVVVLIARMS